jgi:hypothetical protein
MGVITWTCRSKDRGPTHWGHAHDNKIQFCDGRSVPITIFPFFWLHKSACMNTTSNQNIVTGVVSTGIRQEVYHRNLQVCAVSHPTHWWLIVHNVAQPWDSLTQIKGHVSNHVTGSRISTRFCYTRDMSSSGLS